MIIILGEYKKRDKLLLVTKDAMCRDYLPVYGNKYWRGKTPNLDELAEKGTVFNKYYTAAPSTVMSFRSMVMGKFAHETPYADYIPMDIPEAKSDLFNYANAQGYEGHLLWDKNWVRTVLKYGNCFGKNTIIHNMEAINQPVGPHCNHKKPLENDEELLKKTIADLEEEVKSITSTERNIFLWIHLPHVLLGRTGYGEDIDAFDQCIGMLRKYFDDNSIYISADHGNMDGYHEKYSYGFDVYQPAISIPLISPLIDKMKHCDFNVSNVDIKTIIFENKIPRREFIFSDCAYYAQPHRKMAILHDDFAYIYNKKGKSEELYDLEYDWYQRCNLMKDFFYDMNRKLNTMTSEVYFSPRIGEAKKIRQLFRDKRKEVWNEPPFLMNVRGSCLSLIKKVYVVFKKCLSK